MCRKTDACIMTYKHIVNRKTKNTSKILKQYNYKFLLKYIHKTNRDVFVSSPREHLELLKICFGIK